MVSLKRIWFILSCFAVLLLLLAQDKGKLHLIYYIIELDFLLYQNNFTHFNIIL